MLIHTADLPREAPPRRTLAPRTAFALAAGIVGLALFASGIPSPLYGIYRQLWGFSPLVLTLPYATYAFGVLTTLVLAGRLSDDVGRRPSCSVRSGHCCSPPRSSSSPTPSRGCSSRAPSRAWPRGRC